MQTLVNICVTIAVAFVVVLALYLALRLTKRLRAVLLLQEVANEPDAPDPVGRMLRIYYHRLPVFSGVRIPVQTKSGPRLCEVEHLMINRGGILLITSCPQRGFIENPFQGDWRQFSHDTIHQFPNPLEANTANARILNAVLKSRKVENIPIRAIAVFPAEKNRYKNRIEQVMPLSRLVGYIHDMNKNRFLSRMEIHRTASVLKSAMRTKTANRTGSAPAKPFLTKK